jgi:vacuolar-type H+-ATPase subunit C/Vma6
VKFYGYPNTRLRVRKTTLFDSQFFEQLLTAKKTSHIIEALAQTDYRKDIEKGLVKFSGMMGLEEGLKLHLMSTFSDVKRLLKGNDQGQHLVDQMLARFDLHNIKTILRGLHSNTFKEEILRDLVPAGQLDEPLLAGLINQPSVKSFIDQLATFRIPYSKPLMEGFAEYNKTHNLANLELILDKFYYSYVFKGTRGFSKNTKLVREFMQRDIDTTNIMTLLRLTREEDYLEKIAGEAQMQEKKECSNGGKTSVIKHVVYRVKTVCSQVFIKIKALFAKISVFLSSKRKKVEQKIYIAGEQEKLGFFKQATNKLLVIARKINIFKKKKAVEATTETEEEKVLLYEERDVTDFFIEGGKEINENRFIELAKMVKVEEIIKGLKKTSYYKPLKEGMKQHIITGSLASLERKVEDYNIRKTVSLFRDDPLSIGIVVAFMWAKFNEVINLRIILRGKEVEMPQQRIKEALILV